MRVEFRSLMLTTIYLEPLGLLVVKKNTEQETLTKTPSMKTIFQKATGLLNELASTLPTIVPGGPMANLSMLKSRLKTIACVIVLSTTIAPAFADHDDDDRNHNNRSSYNNNNNNNNGRGNGWGWGRRKNDRNNNGVNDKVEKKWAKQDLRRARNFRTYPSDWNDQRVYVANNWNRRNNAYQQAERNALEAQMRTQWQSYNPNYRGQYNWNTYNSPGFLDYVHNGNPGLFTQIRNAIGI
jgi:hypothetical protein